MTLRIAICLRRLGTITCALAASDRAIWLANKAYQAQWAFVNNDSKATYAIAKSLSGLGELPSSAVVNDEGVLTCSSHDRALAMRNHFARVFKGKIVT
eukprot:1846093-Karenia_brevis.AAC.1